MSIYEMHLASWRKHYSGELYAWDEIADALVPYVSDLGFTHVELMPVMQHPFGGSWGYHVTSYFAPDSRFGDPDGLKRLIDRLHQAGIGVILDWVPGHFATDEWALARFDGTPLYEDPNPQRGWHKEWGSHIFNFGRHEVRNFLYANALYWLEEYHADGLRVDGVASMLYLDYAREHGEWSPEHARRPGEPRGGAVPPGDERHRLQAGARRRHDRRGVDRLAGRHRARRSDGGLGFGFKWNMGWMHDSLDYVAKDPLYRSHHHGQMTFSLVYAFAENYVLPISHDEVVHGKGSLLRKMPGDRWQQLANLRAYLAYMWAHPGKQLLFMGCEFGQESEWAESRELDWWLLEHPEHAGVHAMVRDMNARVRRRPARCGAATTSPSGFQWIDANDAGAQHRSRSSAAPPASRDLVCVANFAAPRTRATASACRRPGRWAEILNTDAEVLPRLGRRQPRRRHRRRGRAPRSAGPRRHRGAAPGDGVVPQGGRSRLIRSGGSS